jgi:hypothetical protein
MSAARFSAAFTPLPTVAQYAQTTSPNGAGMPVTPTVNWPDVGAPYGTPGAAKEDAALIVAIETYPHLDPITGAARNGRDWYRYFTEILGVPAENIDTLDDDRAQPEAIMADLASFRSKVGPNGTFWFVFIGHGAPSERSNSGLLITADASANPESIARNSVGQDEIFQELGATAGRGVAIIDACFSGSATGTGKPLMPGLQAARVVRPSVPSNVVVLTAAANDQYAGSLPGAARPAFSYLALGALRGWADSGDGMVTAAEAANYAADTLRILLHGSRRQKPEVSAGNRDAQLTRAIEKKPDLAPILLALREQRGGTAGPAAVAQANGERAVPASPSAVLPTETPDSGKGGEGGDDAPEDTVTNVWIRAAITYPIGVEAELVRRRWNHFQYSLLRGFYANLGNLGDAATNVRGFGGGIAGFGWKWQVGGSRHWELGYLIYPLALAPYVGDRAGSSGRDLMYEIGWLSPYVAWNGGGLHIETGLRSPLVWVGEGGMYTGSPHLSLFFGLGY